MRPSGYEVKERITIYRVLAEVPADPSKEIKIELVELRVIQNGSRYRVTPKSSNWILDHEFGRYSSYVREGVRYFSRFLKPEQRDAAPDQQHLDEMTTYVYNYIQNVIVREKEAAEKAVRAYEDDRQRLEMLQSQILRKEGLE